MIVLRGAMFLMLSTLQQLVSHGCSSAVYFFSRFRSMASKLFSFHNEALIFLVGVQELPIQASRWA